MGVEVEIRPWVIGDWEAGTPGLILKFWGGVRVGNQALSHWEFKEGWGIRLKVGAEQKWISETMLRSSRWPVSYRRSNVPGSHCHEVYIALNQNRKSCVSSGRVRSVPPIFYVLGVTRSDIELRAPAQTTRLQGRPFWLGVLGTTLNIGIHNMAQRLHFTCNFLTSV